jgi:hypothetical protein
MSRADLPVLAVVVATRAGQSLTSALGSVPWASERAVLDPTGEVGPERLPPGVGLGRDARRVATLGTAAWLLLLAEHEVASTSLREQLARAVQRDGAAAWRIGIEVAALGGRLVPRHAPLRLAPRETSRVVVERGLALALASTAGRVGRLGTCLHAAHGESIEAAVEELGVESRVMAALLAQDAQDAGVARISLSSVAAAARLLLARAPARAGLARWITAVFAGYRVVLAHTRAWEWRQAQPVPLREVA